MSHHLSSPARADVLHDSQLDQVSGGPTINQIVRKPPRRTATDDDVATASGALSADPAA